MAKELYKDYLPSNARVIIDYDREKKVKFSYPRKRTYWQSIWNMGFHSVLNYWIALNVCILVLLGAVATVTMIGWCIYSVIQIINNPIITERITSAHLSSPTNTAQLYLAFALLLWFYGVPVIATLILGLNKELGSRVFPKLSLKAHKLCGKMYHVKFSHFDVDKRKIIIPIFSNVYMHYKCTKDFDKYLKRIEVKELPLHIATTNILRKTKKYRYEAAFSAVFYFSKTPKKGYMDVEYA